ncbi:MAG: cadmium-translocating P-type ATPase [Candidatus Parcubacteria bacterium]|jgi:heavy metal translocating P-type ATPase
MNDLETVKKDSSATLSVEETKVGQTIAEKLFSEIEEERKEVKRDAVLTVVTLVGLLVGVAMQMAGMPTLYVYGVFALAYLAGGIPAAIGAFQALREKQLDIDLLMVLAALAAAGVGEVRDGAILLFLFSLAGTLEGYAMGNTKRAVAALMKLRPDEANKLNSDGSTTRVQVEDLLIDDKVIVRPGERMPVDGVIVSGEGAVDQSSVTGESVPVDKIVGDTVFAGTVNQNAVLTVRVTKTAEQSTIARMIEMVTEAQEKRSPSERFSEWFGEKYTYAVLFGSIGALVVFLLIGLPTDLALYKAATLLVVASPCAIVISVPAAVLSAIAAAARTGVLFKGGASLEEFGGVDIVAFDKTGTLTHGKMKVTDIVCLSNIEEGRVLEIAAALEAYSEHPIAASIREYAAEKGTAILETVGATAIPGKGIVATIDGEQYMVGNRKIIADNHIILGKDDDEALGALEDEGKTAVMVARKGELIGIVAVADTIRDSAVEMFGTLRKQGVKRFVVLTGDSERVAHSIGLKLGLSLDEVEHDLLPGDKVNFIEALRKHGKVAFVGDGVNDAAALATAHVGIAMGVGGSDVALEAADVALLSDDLKRISHAHKLSKQANTIIRQNLYFAVGIMALMVVTTVFWYLPLPLGVIGHEGGTLLVVANGLRLLFKHA